MHAFVPLRFNLATAEEELASFERWFEATSFVGETEMVSQIKDRHHMCALLAAEGGIPAPDMIKSELALSGLFRTDLVLGNDSARAFVLVEFEGAEADSLFSNREKTRQYRSFSHQLEHGFGQVVDWAWLKSYDPSSITLTNAFGGPIRQSAYLLICGRDAGIADELERERYEFRRHKTQVEGVRVLTLTYDDMLRAMKRSLQLAKSFSTVGQGREG